MLIINFYQVNLTIKSGQIKAEIVTGTKTSHS